MKVKARSSRAIFIVAVALVMVVSIAAIAVGATSDDSVSTRSSVVAIEEVDILDLERCLEDAVNPDIIQVYENLLRGSENHLRASVSQLESMGIDRELGPHGSERL